GISHRLLPAHPAVPRGLAGRPFPPPAGGLWRGRPVSDRRPGLCPGTADPDPPAADPLGPEGSGMNFLISGTHIAPVWLVAVGFVVGLLGGFFGVGGSFLAAPAL